ncbi:MAG: CRP-like cAMP-binding protein [Gammaproteobacteria bacterium]|jgi:CRP-like cAMP-binding protein
MTEADESLKARLPLLIPINNLPPDQQEQMLRSAVLLDIKKKDYIFRQGDRDSWSFYVTDGEVELLADDQMIKRVVGGEGASFQALAQLQPRQMSAQAKTKAKVLRVDRGLLDRLLSLENSPGPRLPEIEVTELETSASGHWLTEMLQSELFTHVPPSNIHRLLETIESVEFKAGDVVIQQGGPGDYYYAIQSGCCQVIRTSKTGKPIKLAELGPGARFGEEALVSNAKRNATVEMLTDGELARLTKENFIELIRTPVLRSGTLDECRSMVAAGALWLDVRFPEEHQTNGLDASLNIALSSLRASHQRLDRKKSYVVYCDSGGRSSAAAFLLAQEGFDVCYVMGGAIDEITAEKVATKSQDTQTQPKPSPKIEAPTIPNQNDEMVAADTRAQSLTADLEKANYQIEQARRLMAQAQAAKREADRVVEEKLQEERAKIDQKSVVLEGRLEEAQRLKDEIQRQQALAAEDAARRHREQQDRRLALEREAEARLQAEESHIEELYRRQAEKLDLLEQEREISENELQQAWDAIETESTLSKERLDAAKELEAELLRIEQQRGRDLEYKEREMRAALQAELDVERKKLEAEFARTAREIERARRDQAAAEAAQRGAAEEAQRIIEEYKRDQEIHHARQNEKLLVQRQEIERDAQRLKSQLGEAAQARAQAEAIKREAEGQLEKTRLRQDATEASLREEILAIEARAHAATERLRNAQAIEHDAESKQRENEMRLEKTYGTENKINLLLQKELDDWVEEQERSQASAGRRDEIEKQLQQTIRIKERAIQAQRDDAEHDNSLLDEIAERLGERS